MSEVAVKIYEVKRDIRRIHVAHKVSGKDGATQQATFIDSDTLNITDKLHFPRRGFYSFVQIFTGTGITNGGPLVHVESSPHLVRVEENDRVISALRMTKGMFYAAQENLFLELCGFTNLPHSCRIDSYYIMVKYFDDH